MQPPFSKKQLEFILNSTKKWNLAHGSVRSGKTVCTVFRFLEAVEKCPDSKIYIVGHTFDSAYRNIIKLILHSDELSTFRPFCSWSGKKLHYKDKEIIVLGAKDEGAIGNFQGDTYSLVYCDEMTLYPDSIIEMIKSRLSKPYSMGFAAMNPKHPDHIVKKWIDEAEQGSDIYYSLHFTVEDNPYLPESYIKEIKNTTGLFYKRNYLGLWCVGEGSIFDFFDPDIYVNPEPPTAAEYWVAGIDYGTNNPFCCLIVGVSTGKYTQTGKQIWVEKEYYWDPKVKGRQKTNSEFANDLQEFIGMYDVKRFYIDPSAAAFKLELARRGIHTVDANNDVLDGISMMVSEMKRGVITVCAECKNLIREIQSYTWDTSAAEKGLDKPIKKNDHAVDALRYVIATEKVETYQPYAQNSNADEYLRTRFHPGARSFR